MQLSQLLSRALQQTGKQQAATVRCAARVCRRVFACGWQRAGLYSRVGGRSVVLPLPHLQAPAALCAVLPAGSWPARWRRFTLRCASTWQRRRSSYCPCCCATSGGGTHAWEEVFGKGALPSWCPWLRMRFPGSPSIAAVARGHCNARMGPRRQHWATVLPAHFLPRSYGEQAELVAQFLCCIPLATVQQVGVAPSGVLAGRRHSHVACMLLCSCCQAVRRGVFPAADRLANPRLRAALRCRCRCSAGSRPPCRTSSRRGYRRRSARWCRTACCSSSWWRGCAPAAAAVAAARGGAARRAGAARQGSMRMQQPPWRLPNPQLRDRRLLAVLAWLHMRSHSTAAPQSRARAQSARCASHAAATRAPAAAALRQAAARPAAAPASGPCAAGRPLGIWRGRAPAGCLETWRMAPLVAGHRCGWVGSVGRLERAGAVLPIGGPSELVRLHTLGQCIG